MPSRVCMCISRLIQSECTNTCLGKNQILPNTIVFEEPFICVYVCDRRHKLPIKLAGDGRCFFFKIHRKLFRRHVSHRKPQNSNTFQFAYFAPAYTYTASTTITLNFRRLCSRFVLAGNEWHTVYIIYVS